MIPQPRPLPSPEEAVRAELRAHLYDLSDALLDHAGPTLLLEAIRHASALAALAGEGDGVIAALLRNLNRDLRTNRAAVDAHYFANAFTKAANRLSER